jgi:perosamine synthetase
VIFRRQLPAWSPITARSVLSAWRAAFLPGDELSELEALLRKEYGPTGVVLTDSGTSALALAMLVSAHGRGRPPVVALPAYGCYDLATAADIADAGVVLYDVDPETLGPDWDSFGAALAHRPDAAVAVHLFGYPVDMRQFSARAEAAGTVVIEDAAQASGASLDGRREGTMGQLAVLSFGRGKGRTGGGGGALLVHDGSLLEAAAGFPLEPARGRFRIPALLTAQWIFGRPALYGLVASLPFLRLGETVYRPPRPIRGSVAPAAAGLLSLWDAAATAAEDRKRRAVSLLERLREEVRLRAVVRGRDAEPGYLRLPLLLGGGQVRSRDRRVGVMPGYRRALADLPGFERRLLVPGQALPGARWIAARLITVPTHSQLTRGDERRIGALLGADV